MDAQVRGAAWGWRVCAHCPLLILVPSPGLYQEVHLEELTAAELTGKLAELLGLPAGQIQRVSRQGPSGIHILVSDMVRTRGDTSGGVRPCSPPGPSGSQTCSRRGSAPMGAPHCGGTGVWAHPGSLAPPSPCPAAPQMVRNLLDESCFMVAIGKGNVVAVGRQSWAGDGGPG